MISSQTLGLNVLNFECLLGEFLAMIDMGKSSITLVLNCTYYMPINCLKFVFEILVEMAFVTLFFWAKSHKEIWCFWLRRHKSCGIYALVLYRELQGEAGRGIAQ